jgi:two-component system, OmpR family, sensor kinase
MTPSNLPSPEARLLGILEHLLGLEILDLKAALDQAASAIASAFQADKVDVFLHEPDADLLVAVGMADTPMARREQELGLDRLPAASGGSTWRVFQTGQSFLTGHAEQDPDELPGLVQELGVRSNMGAAIEVNGHRRGVLLVASRRPEQFSVDDLRFLEAVAYWVGLGTARAALLERIAAEAAEAAYRLAAEQTVEVLTARQQEVAGLIASGCSNAEIAERLRITPGTAANHVEHILGQLRFKSRSQIAVWAVERGLYRSGQEPVSS